MKHVTLVPVGGLSNRIYATTAAINLCKKLQYSLDVIWFNNKELGADFYELFQPKNLDESVKIKSAHWTDFFKYNKPIKSNFFLPRMYQKFNFDDTYYYFQEKISVEEWLMSHKDKQRFYLNHCQKFYDTTGFQEIFQPTCTIQQKIKEQIQHITPDTIGVHLRRTDLTLAIQQSPLSAFVEKMKQEIEKNPSANFYVASDDVQEKELLKKIFKDKILTAERILNRHTQQGIIDAIVEQHILAHTKMIWGSVDSTYSQMAAEIRQIPLEIIKITPTK